MLKLPSAADIIQNARRMRRHYIMVKFNEAIINRAFCKTPLPANKKYIAMKREEFMVAAIENGTVIDHIPCAKLFEDYEVVEKKQVTLPGVLRNIVRCANPKCITNNEPMNTLFSVTDAEQGTILCHYCNKEQQLANAKLV